MASLKDLRGRIASVKSTQKITSAMKMVAASKLRRAQEAAEAARPYAERMDRMLGGLAGSMAGLPGAPKLLSGTGKDEVHLVVVMTADRGLCGGFNGSIVRATRHLVAELRAEGKQVKLLTIGRKGRDALKRDHKDLLIEGYEGVGKKGLSFSEADDVAARILAMYENGEFDVCTVVYNKFKSAISQVVTRQQLVPFPVPEAANANEADTGPKASYEYEPSEEGILAELLPRARMAAMDNATRNAGEMIHKLTLTYNRTRQAMITSELIEIISGAEAL
jgi:F-type H+-transporting ATPase subunit gamma